VFGARLVRSFDIHRSGYKLTRIFFKEIRLMLKRVRGYLAPQDATNAPAASLALEQQGYAVLRSVLTPEEVQLLAEEINVVFDQYPRDNRPGEHRTVEDDEMFRYEMLNRSPRSQAMVAHADVLAVIEPLLGDDCHVIANTAWRNPAGHPGSHGGQAWHIDAGPHVPLAEGASWPETIPHPVFAIGIHVYLMDCNLDDGPTGVIPRSHLSGQFPPPDRALDEQLSYGDQSAIPLLARAGDVALFVSDVWHRRLPTGTEDPGRFFLQVHYGRRDIAQRLHSTNQTNQLSAEAIDRAESTRQKTVIGLHRPFFYDG